ncbi:MAG TPA: hypothetical protein VKT31_11365 [Solirubrobacteraceae bacterium]|nr:hypothetical protein [Solirubrobacteraceae bacterium]
MGDRVWTAIGSEEGFTLMELLVAMMAGVVVIGALMTMVDVTLRQTTRTFSKVGASQNARIVTQKIEDELHSACVASGVTPVQASSDANNLIFVSLWGNFSSSNPANAPSPTPVEHKIVYSSGTGTLTDYTYAATGGTSPNWTFSSSASSTVILATNVSASGSTPVFQYFDFSQPTNGGTAYTDSAGNTYMMIQDGINYLPGSTSIKPAAAPLATPLSSANAALTSEVLVTLSAAPQSSSLVETGLSNVSSTVQDQIVLRLTPPANHAGNGATFVPCA